MLRRPQSEQGLESCSPARATVASGCAVTVIAWFVSRVVVGAGWGPARDPFSFRPALWAHGDSWNYLAMAAAGRTFGRCGTPAFPGHFGVKAQWCGTAGWLPGYPWIVRVLSSMGVSRPYGAMVVPWVALAVAMFLVWFGWGRDLGAGRALALLVLFGLFPGSVYNFAIFPTSVALACVVGAVLAAVRTRFFVAALLIAVAGLCYPTAWFAAVGLAVGLAVVAVPQGPAVLLRRALWGLAGLTSLLVLGIHDQLAFDHFDAYFLRQSQDLFHRGTFPGQQFLRLVFTRSLLVQKLMGRFSAAVLAFQAVVALSLAGAGAVVAGRAWRRKQASPALLYPALVGITVAVVLVFVTRTGGWDRSVVLAAPCVVGVRRAPLPVLCAMVAVVGVTTAVVSRSFFAGQLM